MRTKPGTTNTGTNGRNAKSVSTDGGLFAAMVSRREGPQTPLTRSSIAPEARYGTANAATGITTPPVNGAASAMNDLTFAVPASSPRRALTNTKHASATTGTAKLTMTLAVTSARSNPNRAAERIAPPTATPFESRRPERATASRRSELALYAK